MVIFLTSRSAKSMRRFDLVEPATLEEACGFIANKDDAKVIVALSALAEG
jgi:hypothetical protein